MLPWISPKFTSLIFHRRGVAFIFLSFKSSSLIALCTSQVTLEKLLRPSIISRRCSFSGFPIWSGPVTSQVVYTAKTIAVIPRGYFLIMTTKASDKLPLATHCHSGFDLLSSRLSTQIIWDCLALLPSATSEVWIDQTSAPANATLFPSHLSTSLGPKISVQYTT